MRSEGHASEIEVTFIIWLENARGVARQIADLTRIGNYQLLPQDSKSIHDLYFDSPDRNLRNKKLALRVREIDATRWITLKGPSQPTGWGGVERLEIEAPWSLDALNRVLKELTARRVKLPGQNQELDSIHPLDVMTSLGLKVVQDRKTHRRVRNIVTIEGGPLLAELAIDSVVYHFRDQEIYHHEVEIEAKVRDGSTVLKAVIGSLGGMYGPVLRRWDHSKLATGMAIERLLSEVGPQGLLDIDNHLKPAAYDKIHDWLKRSSL